MYADKVGCAFLGAFVRAFLIQKIGFPKAFPLFLNTMSKFLDAIARSCTQHMRLLLSHSLFSLSLSLSLPSIFPSRRIFPNSFSQGPPHPAKTCDIRTKTRPSGASRTTPKREHLMSGPWEGFR